MKIKNYENENALILELCQFINPKTKLIEKLTTGEIDWIYVLGQILYNRIGGIVYHTYKKCNLLSKLNREFRNTLEIVYKHNIKKTMYFQFHLAKLGKVLKNANFQYSILKGGFLCEKYPLGLRTSNDIDILINGKNLNEMNKILHLKDYRQGYIKNGSFVYAERFEIIESRINRGETIPYILTTDNQEFPFVEVDLNFSLDYQGRTGSEKVLYILENGAIVKTKDCLKTLSIEFFIAHLCVHLYKEATTKNWVDMNRDQALYKYIDLYLILNEEIISNEKLIKVIKDLKIENECYYSLTNTMILFDSCKNYDSVLEEIKSLNMEFMNKIFDPQTNKYYKHDFGIKEWIFMPNRGGNYNEA